MYSPRTYIALLTSLAALHFAGCGQNDQPVTQNRPLSEVRGASSLGQSPAYFTAKWGEPEYLTDTSGTWKGELSTIRITFENKRATEIVYTLTKKEALWTEEQISACLQKHGTGWKREEYSNDSWMSAEGNHAQLADKAMTITEAARYADFMRQVKNIEKF